MIADVVSSDVVGYATSSSVEQNNFYNPSFTSVGYNTANIQDIKISDGGANSIGWGEEIFEIWAGAPSVVAGSGFFYYDPSMDPNGEQSDYYWGDDTGAYANYSVAQGQSVVINTAASDLTFTDSGTVPSGAVSVTTVEQNNFTGNPFPAAIDIQNIKISDEGANSIGWGEEIFEIWAGAPSVVAGSGFFYYDPSMDPNGEQTDYYWGDDTGAYATYSIAAGQGIVINTAAADLTITIEAPYSL